MIKALNSRDMDTENLEMTACLVVNGIEGFVGTWQHCFLGILHLYL
jgi:hypothetical protein